MSFLEPLSLAWLGLAIPLVLLYVLKRRREERVIGSTLLWSLAQRDLRAERPWQRLIPHLSLLLQLLALSAGAFALARPAGAGHIPSGARIVVVLDTSASMAARDEDGVRFERARAELSTLASSLPTGGELAIVDGAGEPSVLLPPTGDLARLEAAIRGLTVRGGAQAIEQAVALASERLEGAPSGSRIVVLTDAAATGTLTLASSLPVEVSRIGAPELRGTFNDAILAVDVRAHPTEAAPDRTEIFARVERFGGSAGDVFVSAEVGGEVIASRRVRLDPGTAGSALLTADLPPDATGRAPIVSVHLRRDDDSPDGLSEDDVVVAPSPGARRLPVFLVGDVPESVRRVLLTDGNAELFATTVEALAAREDETELEGVYVFGGITPSTPPPGEVLVVAPAALLFGAELPEPVEHPRIITWDENDPRLRFTTFGSVHIASLRPLEVPSYGALVTSEAGPAIASLVRPDGVITVMGFDPDHSDWPRQAGFVIFFRNLLESARARRAAGGIAPGRIGEPLRIPAPEGAEVVVTSPDGSVQRGVARGGIAIVSVPAQPGVFAVRAGTSERFALRNLLDPEESDLSARAEWVTTNGSATGGVSEAREPLEAWPYVAMFLLVVLVTEALWATRKGAAA